MVFLNLGQAYFSVDLPKDLWICFSCGLNNEHIVVQSSNMKYTLVRLGMGLARLGMFLIEIIYFPVFTLCLRMCYDRPPPPVVMDKET